MNNEEKILTTLENISLQMGIMGSRIDSLDSRIESMDAKFTAKFEQVDARFEQVDARFEQIDARFEQIDARFEQIDARFEQVDAQFEQIRAFHMKVENEYDKSIKANLEGFSGATEKNTEQDRRISTLENRADNHGSRISVLEAAIRPLS